MKPNTRTVTYGIMNKDWTHQVKGIKGALEADN